MSKAKSFRDIMSEEYAQKLQNEEDEDLLLAIALSEQEAKNAANIVENQEKNEEKNNNNNNNEENNLQFDEDYVYALQLQEQFDKQREEEKIREMEVQSKQSKFSKITVTYDKFRSIPSHSITDPYSDEEEENEEEFDEEGEEEEEYEKDGKIIVSGKVPSSASNKPSNNKPQGRLSKEKHQSNNTTKTITTKHDLLITGKLNAINLDQKLGHNFGNLEELDVPISNSIFSSLKQHAEREESRRIRYHGKEDRETREHVMDPRTRILLYKMLNNGLLNEVGGVLSSGKEANVYLGLTDHLPPHLIVPSNSSDSYVNQNLGDDTPGFYAIKIYKTTLNEFKNRDLYLKYDYRFRFKHNKQNPRKFIAVWAEKERDNLLRMKKVDIPCPEVVLLRKHILVMQFIGDRNGVKAPHLRDAINSLSVSEIDRLYKECAHFMRTLFQKAKLVHGDLSAYNILYFHKQLYFIDVAQAVEHEHPYAFAFLKRDCENINRFFESAGASWVLSTKELFLFIVNEKLSIGDVLPSPVNLSDNVVDLKPHFDDSSFDSFWSSLASMAITRGKITEEMKSDDEIYLNGFLPRHLGELDDDVNLSSVPYISQLLAQSNNDSQADEDDDEDEFDEEYEVKQWEVRPKLTKEEQKNLRKEAKKRFREMKRAKRPLNPPHNPSSQGDNNDNDDANNDNAEVDDVEADEVDGSSIDQ